MASSATPYAARQSHMDECGFLFVLPRLGLPDLGGEWVTVKAAIGKKRDIVDLVVHPANYSTPLRQVNLEEAAFIPIEHHGAIWVFFLVKPKSFSSTAPPEFFSIKLKRMRPDGSRLPVETVPAQSDWLVFPYSAYTDQMNNLHSNEPLARLEYGGGTVEMVENWQDYERRERERGDNDISEEDALRGDFIDARWRVRMLTKAVSDHAQNDHSSINSDDFGVYYRIRPEIDNDIRSVDYVVARLDEMRTKEMRESIAEERWRPLPVEACKPGGERQFVNVQRRANGLAPFSKEEWPPAPATERGSGGTSIET